MPDLITCAGHPRDMGLDQGRDCRAAVLARLAAAALPTRRRRLPRLSAWAAGPRRGAGAGRELIRHYTHLAERIDGLARGAGVDVDAIVALHLEAGTCGPAGELGGLAVAVASAAVRDHEGPLLARTLPPSPPPGAAWLLRRSRPAVGFDSLEVTLPWLVASVAGVNEGGLCAAFVPDAPSSSGPAADPAPAPPAFLLVQECLQRFRDLEAALGWCGRRPAAGRGCVVLADARGDLGAVRFDAAGRSVVRPLEGVLVAGADADRADRMRKRIAEQGVLAAAGPEADELGQALVRLSSRGRLLGLRGGGVKHVELTLEA